MTGGYDAELNQIVVCQNTATSKAAVHGALAHEMVHMFDFCRAHIDFTNVDHLLCTEVKFYIANYFFRVNLLDTLPLP